MYNELTMKITTLKQFQALIDKHKTDLIAKAERCGVDPRFGDDEGRHIEDALIDFERLDTTGSNYEERRQARIAVRQFHEWTINHRM